jgi:DNA adenine methylase
MKLPQPIQYQGSKRLLAPFILRYLPEKFSRLIEPFAGTAALSIAAATRGITRKFWLNDLNAPLIELLRLIVQSPDALADFYKTLWNQQHDDSLEHYYRVREDFNRTRDARLFLYLLARCVKGAVRYNSDGLFNQSPDKRRHGTRPETMRGNIAAVSTLLRGRTKFSHLDYRDVLAEAMEGDVIYMDPPYQGVCGERDSRYFAGIAFDDFVDALVDLNQHQIAYLVSYDGRRGGKQFGRKLPDYLNLTLVELDAGRSSQSTLLGRDEMTVESLYLSPALMRRIEVTPSNHSLRGHEQIRLLESPPDYGKAAKRTRRAL